MKTSKYSVNINFSKACFLGSLFFLCFSISYAQKNELTSNQVKQIEKAIDAKLGEYFENLKATITAPSDRQQYQESIFDIFNKNQDAKIEKDYPATITKTGQSEILSIYNYLNEFHNNLFAIGKEKEITINFKLEWNQRLYKTKGVTAWQMTSFVNFSQEYRAIDEKNKKYQRADRVVEVQIEKKGNDWDIKFNAIYFKGGVNTELNLPLYNIIEDKNDYQVSEFLPEAYFKGCLEQGTSEFQNKKYGCAFRNLSEAVQTNNPDIKGKAGKKLNDLKEEIRSTIGEWDEAIYPLLKSEAENLERKKNYVLALSYYTYASKLRVQANIDNAKLLRTIDDLSKRVDYATVMDRLFKSSNYEAAIAKYTEALQADANNSYFYLGLAKCYFKQGNSSMANDYFDKAIKTDPSNTSIYEWQAESYKQIGEYKKASDAYSHFAEYAEDGFKKIKINSYTSSCNGILAYNASKFDVALNLFKDACNIYEDNMEALCYQSLCYLNITTSMMKNKTMEEVKTQQKENFKAALEITNTAIIRDSNYSDAYRVKAILTATPKNSRIDKKPNLPEAIKLYDKAILKDKNNMAAYEELGLLYLERYKSENDAKDLVNAKDNFYKEVETIEQLKTIRPVAYQYKARTLYFSQDYKAAVETFSKCSLDNADYWNEYAFAWLKYSFPGNLDSAKRKFNIADNKKPQNPETVYGLLLCNLKKGIPLNNNDISNLEKIIASGVKQERVKKDFKDLGLDAYLNEKTIKDVLKR